MKNSLPVLRRGIGTPLFETFPPRTAIRPRPNSLVCPPFQFLTLRASSQSSHVGVSNAASSAPFPDLQAAVNRFVSETNNDPKPFILTADPNKIIAAVRRGHQV